MATEEKVPQKEFATAKTSVVIKPKTKNELVMIYRGLQDLKSLILFVGSRPVLNADASIQYKKFIIADNSVVFRNGNGQVSKVMTFEEAENLYDIAADSFFKNEHSFQATAPKK